MTDVESEGVFRSQLLQQNCSREHSLVSLNMNQCVNLILTRLLYRLIPMLQDHWMAEGVREELMPGEQVQVCFVPS